MADRQVVLNHVLCFLFSKVHREDENRIIDAISKFFNDSDISIARDLLLEQANLIGTTLPRLPARRSVGDGRRNRELKDIFQMINTLDTAKTLEKLPIFASNDPSEMPSANITDGDLRSIMLRLDQLDGKMDAIANIQVAMFDSQQRINKPGQSRDGRSIVRSTVVSDHSARAHPSRLVEHLTVDNNSALTAPNNSNVNSGVNVTKSRRTDLSMESVSDYHATTEDNVDSEPFQLSSAAKRKQRSKRRRVQSKTNSPIDQLQASDPDPKSDTGVAVSYSTVVSRPASQRNSQLLVGRKPNNTMQKQNQQNCSNMISAAKPYLGKAVFCVDNVAPNVDVDDMHEFVTSIGVRVVTCNKVPPRRPLWQKRRGIMPHDRCTFRLCILRIDVDKLLNADIWPENISISRWIFSKNPRPPTSDEINEIETSTAIEHQLKVSRSLSNINSNRVLTINDSLSNPTVISLEDSCNQVASQPHAEDNSSSSQQGMDATNNDLENGE
jgi:hypothetical protein